MNQHLHWLVALCLRHCREIIAGSDSWLLKAYAMAAFRNSSLKPCNNWTWLIPKKKRVTVSAVHLPSLPVCAAMLGSSMQTCADCATPLGWQKAATLALNANANSCYVYAVPRLQAQMTLAQAQLQNSSTVPSGALELKHVQGYCACHLSYQSVMSVIFGRQ